MPKFDEEQVRHLELIAKALEKGQSFNSLFIAAGYVTFFALWNNVTGCATPASHMVAGAALTLSVVVYVAWMVVGLVALNVTMMTLVKQAESSPRPLAVSPPINTIGAASLLREALANKDSGFTPAERVQYRLALLTLEMGKVWPYVLIAIMVPALLGIAIVFSTYIHGAWLASHGVVLRCFVPSAH
ncbi:hypothetical protein HFP05_01645 [Rhodanobacter denitrificans]|nr:hypothetical protein [Rhodanobacter denitrificans]